MQKSCFASFLRCFVSIFFQNDNDSHLISESLIFLEHRPAIHLQLCKKPNPQFHFCPTSFGFFSEVEQYNLWSPSNLEPL